MNDYSAPKRSQRRFALTKPQVTIYRKRGQCVLHRAQPQICAKKLAIRTKYRAGANCSRWRQQQTRSKPGKKRGGANERRRKRPGNAAGHPVGAPGQGAQQNTQLGHIPRTPGGTRRRYQRAEKRQRSKPALPHRAICACRCCKSSRVSTSNNSHSLETSMARTHSACTFAT